MNAQRKPASKPTPPKTGHPLVGRAFHSFDADGAVQWQGSVVADLGDGYFLMQLAEWMIGESTYQVILHISELGLTAAENFSVKRRFVFYPTVEHMIDYYDRVLRHKNEHIRLAKEKKAGDKGAVTHADRPAGS